MKYIISDLHGCYDKFIKMLKLINFKSDDQMYILGDVVDRGKDSIKLLQYVMKQKNIELLLGNHEEMMLQWIKNNDYGYLSCWMNNGGQSTYSQFFELDEVQRASIIDYLNHRPPYKIIDNYILVHAGLCPSLYAETIEDLMKLQNRDTLLWARDEFIFSPALKDYVIIFGHTPTCDMQSSNPMTIWHDKDKIGIDCGSVFGKGQLGCLRLDDMKEFYV